MGNWYVDVLSQNGQGNPFLEDSLTAEAKFSFSFSSDFHKFCLGVF